MFIDEVWVFEFGVMKIDNLGWIVEFSEKLKGNVFKVMVVDIFILGVSLEIVIK